MRVDCNERYVVQPSVALLPVFGRPSAFFLVVFGAIRGVPPNKKERNCLLGRVYPQEAEHTVNMTLRALAGQEMPRGGIDGIIDKCT